jgi:hypothetical protein
LNEDQLRLRVKSVILIIVLNVIKDSDGGKHAHNVAIGADQSGEKLRRWPGADCRRSMGF